MLGNELKSERIINMSRQIRTSAKAVIIQNGRLLAIKIKDGREEVGIEVQCKDLLFVIEGVHGESFHRIDLVFLCDYLGKAESAALHIYFPL